LLGKDQGQSKNKRPIPMWYALTGVGHALPFWNFEAARFRERPKILILCWAWSNLRPYFHRLWTTFTKLCRHIRDCSLIVTPFSDWGYLDGLQS